VTVDRDGVHVATRIAMADDGGESEGHDGDGSHSDHDGGDHSDHDRGDHSERDGGQDSAGGDGRKGDDVSRDDDDNAARSDDASGAGIKGNRNAIEVVHPSGIREEINNGRYEMKDARGRQIVERAASAADFARLANTTR
jgi:hypothetical protein